MMWLALVLMGCLSVRNLQTAEPLGKGRTEIGVDAGYVLVEGLAEATEGTLPGVVPSVNVSFRHGVTARSDVLVEASSSIGIGLGFKTTLTNPESNGLAVAIAPRVSVSTQIITSSVQASVPVLFGIPLGEHELTVGPRVDWWSGTLIVEQLGAVRSVGVGGNASLALRLGPVRLIPEVAISKPLFGNVRVGDQTTGADVSADSPLWIQPNLAILIGTTPPPAQ